MFIALFLISLLGGPTEWWSVNGDPTQWWGPDKADPDQFLIDGHSMQRDGETNSWW